MTPSEPNIMLLDGSNFFFFFVLDPVFPALEDQKKGDD